MCSPVKSTAVRRQGKAVQKKHRTPKYCAHSKTHPAGFPATETDGVANNQISRNSALRQDISTHAVSG